MWPSLRGAPLHAHVATPTLTAPAVTPSSAWMASMSLEVEERAGVLRVIVESAPSAVACPVCGVVAGSHGRRVVHLIDAPCFGCPGPPALAQADLVVRRGAL
jgi:hypothetical protein